MRDVLLDVIKQTTGVVDTLRITGTETETVIKGCDADKVLFVDAKLKLPVPDFEGDFGLTNMNILNGLLNFTNYRTDDATLSVKRRERNGKTMVEQIEFRNSVTGNNADFRMMDPALIPEQATIPDIPWDVVVTPSKSKLAEFGQLGSLYSELDKSFGARTVGGDLQFYIGDDNSSSHRANMVFEHNVKGELKGTLQWFTHQFMALMKLTGGNPTELKITSRGVLSISVETAHGTYNYFLRANR
jgi:hypothetical protein